MSILSKLLGLRDLNEATRALNAAAIRPIPVQSFPVTDDMRFEKEKQQLACAAG